MAEAQKSAPLAQTRLAGRVIGSRTKQAQNGRLFFTLMRLPAPDAYTSPATVEVTSADRVGAVGDEVSILCNVGGYPRSFDGKGEHGEPGATIRTAQNSLTFVGFA